MSLQKKIEQEMNDLAFRIIRRSITSTDEKTAKMCSAWFDLKRLLDKASEIDSKVSKGDRLNVGLVVQ